MKLKSYIIGQYQGVKMIVDESYDPKCAERLLKGYENNIYFGPEWRFSIVRSDPQKILDIFQ